jgi:hypothetical protein
VVTNNRVFHRFRAAVAMVVGVWILTESANPNFLRPAVESRATFVHVALAVFGITFLVHGAVLLKRLTSSSSH